MNPEQVVTEMFDVYARAETYRDNGCITTRRTSSGGAAWERDGGVAFSTVFARPDRVRYEERRFSHSGACLAHHISWTDGEDYSRWRSPSAIDRPSSLLVALGGRSVFSVRHVLALLVPRLLPGGDLGYLIDLTLLPQETLDGAACHRVQGSCSWWNEESSPEEQVEYDSFIERLEQLTGEKVPPGRTLHPPLTIWMDRETMLIRRIESGRIEEKYREDTVVTYQPQVNVPLDPSELQFDPPGVDGSV